MKPSQAKASEGFYYIYTMNIETLHQHFLKSSGISTDSRNILKNSLFFALKGDNFNGNLFAQEALDKGAYKVIVDEKQNHKSSGETVLVDSVLFTLQQLAHFHREYLGLTILALTGSNGKTTTKELIYAVLSKKYITQATKGNLNNHIGVPLTLLSIAEDTEIGVVEMGANHPQEIEILSNIAQPNFGYITNFGKAHLEGFLNLEGVVKAKTELYRFLQTNRGTVFVNAEDLKQVDTSKNLKRISFGKQDADYNIELVQSEEALEVRFKGVNIKTHLVGAYNFANISAAITIGAYFGIETILIKEALEGYIPSNNRSQLIHKGSNQILMDAYNANPTSMLAALENFQQSKGENKILFLGDMFELGQDAHKEHQNIVDYIEDNNIGKTFLIGENFFRTISTSDKILKFANFEKAKEAIENNLPKDSYILIKASRGMALERILDII